VEEIPRQDVDDIGVSSTKIRRAIESGDIPTANRYLGHTYTLTSTVEEGNKLGRTIGYPTANLALPAPHKLIPANGVYAVWVKHDGQRLPGMMNIGTRPTVDGSHLTSRSAPARLRGRPLWPYLTVEFVEQLRQEQKFDGLDALKAQLAKDKAATEKVLALG
jgi:riboflavin kinase / FMN adenylyltransferase